MEEKQETIFFEARGVFFNVLLKNIGLKFCLKYGNWKKYQYSRQRECRKTSNFQIRKKFQQKLHFITTVNARNVL
jgi:hypothetical protein